MAALPEGRVVPTSGMMPVVLEPAIELQAASSDGRQLTFQPAVGLVEETVIVLRRALHSGWCHATSLACMSTFVVPTALWHHRPAECRSASTQADAFISNCEHEVCKPWKLWLPTCCKDS